MSTGDAIRWTLLAILPIIALLIYTTGRRYDSSMYYFTPAPSIQSIKLPAQIEGCKLSGRPRTYTRDNLYESIDGHAEFFISNGFQSLEVGEYSKATGEPAFVVDIFDMGKDMQAFGVFVDEAGEGLDEAAVGTMGYMSAKLLTFFKDRY